MADSYNANEALKNAKRLLSSGNYANAVKRLINDTIDILDQVGMSKYISNLGLAFNEDDEAWWVTFGVQNVDDQIEPLRGIKVNIAYDAGDDTFVAFQEEDDDIDELDELGVADELDALSVMVRCIIDEIRDDVFEKWQEENPPQKD